MKRGKRLWKYVRRVRRVQRGVTGKGKEKGDRHLADSEPVPFLRQSPFCGLILVRAEAREDAVVFERRGVAHGLAARRNVAQQTPRWCDVGQTALTIGTSQGLNHRENPRPDRLWETRPDRDDARRRGILGGEVLRGRVKIT